MKSVQATIGSARFDLENTLSMSLSTKPLEVYHFASAINCIISNQF